MATALLSEGILAKYQNWKFFTGDEKTCFTPAGNFKAEKQDTLHFWPTILTAEGTVLCDTPHIHHPVGESEIDALISEMRGYTSASDSDDFADCQRQIHHIYLPQSHPREREQ